METIISVHSVNTVGKPVWSAIIHHIKNKAIPNNSKHGVALYQVSKYENQKVKKLLKDY